MDKAFITPPPELEHSHSKGFNLFKISLVVFTFCLFIGGIAYSVLAKPYNCIPCKENNYCIKGIRYECPLAKPVTQGNRKTSEDDCMTCVQRNGDETNPVYDITIDDCVSCYEYSNGATPVWNGSECVACDTNTPKWENGVCTACPNTAPLWTGIKCVTPQFEITSGNTEIKIIEQPARQAFETVAPTAAETEDETFLETYGINNASSVYPDYWGGAMKYCQDQGLKMPTNEEFLVILEAALEQELTCNDISNCTIYIEKSKVPTDNEIFNSLFNYNSASPGAYYTASQFSPSYSFRVSSIWAPSQDGSNALEIYINSRGYRGNDEGGGSYYNILCIETNTK